MEPLNNKKKTIISIVATCVVITGLTVFCGYLLTRNNVLAKENQELRAENHYSNVLAPPPLPYSITFAGENVPLDNLMVRESLDRELTAICFQHGTTLMCLKRSGRWFPLIEKILKEEGLPEDFKYLCIAESSLQNAISPAKAVGFWQFLEGTARSYGLEVTDEVDERYDVEKATRAACKYLKAGKQSLGSWSLAAAGYNMGTGGVSKNMKLQSVDNYWDMYLNQETARYVFRIIAYKAIFENPHIYGVRISPEEKQKPVELEEVKITQSIANLYDFCKEHKITYKELKTWNPWLRSSKLTVKDGKSYSIKIPKK